MGLSLLSQAYLPLSYWDHAFHTAVYLINRLPTAHNPAIPLHTLFHKQPDLSFLKMVDCACYPLLRPYNNHKLQFRSSKCLFLGYSSSHKRYKCLHVPSSRLFISKDVLFDEHKFPFQYASSKVHSPAPFKSTMVPLGVVPPGLQTTAIPTSPAHNSPIQLTSPLPHQPNSPSPNHSVSPLSEQSSPSLSLPSTASSTIDPDSPSTTSSPFPPTTTS